ncbi:MAG: Maf family protein [Clostridia bacterium]|nr:Maf family protein [Clostridia bacterium]
MDKLILASASPRRRELLQEITPFRVETSLFEERASGLSARETAEYFAAGKAKEVFSRFPDYFVLGADTVVEYAGKILGKPKDRADAKKTLSMLSGNTHNVYTGVCLVGKGFCKTISTKTLVTFFPLTEELIERYVESGLPLDKAGSYGIQDGYPLVEKYEGSYTGVVGLPVEEVRAILEEAEIHKC